MPTFKVVAVGEVQSVRDLTDGDLNVREVSLPGMSFQVRGHGPVDFPEVGTTAIVTEPLDAPYRHVLWHDGTAFTSIVVNKDDMWS